MSADIKATDKRQAPFVYYDIELDDAGLNPYEFRIYNRIARRAGGGDHSCTESLNSMAEGCQMSRNSVKRAIARLATRKMITCVRRSGEVSEYDLLDKSHWLTESPQSRGSALTEPGVSPHRAGGRLSRSRGSVPTEPGVGSHRPPKKTIKKTIKKTREENGATPLAPIADESFPTQSISNHPVSEEIPATKDHPAIKFLRSLTNRYPDKSLWPKIALTLGAGFDPDRVGDCYREWVGRGFNKMNFAWLFDWYVSGIPAAKAAPRVAQDTSGKHIPDYLRFYYNLDH